MNIEIEQFGKILVKHVRDGAIRLTNRRLTNEPRTVLAKRWEKASLENGSKRDFAKFICPDIVDGTIATLLQAVDQGILKISYKAESGNVIDLTEEGLAELQGWYMGSEGWRQQYSSEPVSDDLSPQNPTNQ